jgi:hypothetical protein
MIGRSSPRRSAGGSSAGAWLLGPRRKRPERSELRSILEITEAVSGRRASHGHEPHRRARRRAVGAQRCSIVLVDGGNVRPRRQREPRPTCWPSISPSTEIRRAVETREPVYIEDVSRDPLEPVRNPPAQAIARAVMPLVFGEVLGTLFL